MWKFVLTLNELVAAMNSDRNKEKVKILPLGKISQSVKQPHAQRIQQVFLVLDEAASVGVTTYSGLIDFVQAKTGKGCSKKLIAKWKKERAQECTAIVDCLEHPMQLVDLRCKEADVMQQPSNDLSVFHHVRAVKPKLVSRVVAATIGLGLLLTN